MPSKKGCWFRFVGTVYHCPATLSAAVTFELDPAASPPRGSEVARILAAIDLDILLQRNSKHQCFCFGREPSG